MEAKGVVGRLREIPLHEILASSECVIQIPDDKVKYIFRYLLCAEDRREIKAFKE